MVPNRLGNEQTSRDVFLSYSVKDLAKAEAVCRGLEDSGLSCWFASRDMPPAGDLSTVIVEAIRSSGVLTLVLSASSNESIQIAREIELAVSMGHPVIPFAIEDIQLSGRFRYLLSDFRQIDASRPPVEGHLDQLVAFLRSIGATSPASTEESPSSYTSYRAEWYRRRLH